MLGHLRQGDVGHEIGPRSVRGGALEASETRFGHGSFGCTFLVPQVWQKLVLIRGDDGMIDRTLLAPTPAKKNNKDTLGNQALAVPSHSRKRSAKRTA